MATSFFSTIILIGAMQGVVMSGLLFSLKKNKVPARFLAWLLILISVASLNIWSWSVASWQNSDLYAIITQCFPLIVVMPVGPLIWLYVRSTLDPTLKIGRKEKLHFLPVIIDLVPPLISTVFLIILLCGLNRNFGPAIGRFIDYYNVYSDIPRWFSITYYCLISMRLLKSKARQTQIEEPTAHLKWLTQFLTIFAGFQTLWFIYLVPYVIPKYTDWVLDHLGWYPIYVPLALLIYVFGTKGYLQVKQLRQLQKKETVPLYDNDEVKSNIAILVESMEQKRLYLEASLNLSVLSAETKIPAKQISAILNQHMNKSFNEFINGYRVNEVIRRLSVPGTEKLTIAGLAYECGFNSQPTFQRAFKSATGKTPSRYISENSIQQTTVKSGFE